MKSFVTFLMLSILVISAQAQLPDANVGRVLSPNEIYQARRNLVQWWLDNKYGHRCSSLGGNQFWQAILSPYTHKKLKLDGLDPLLSSQFSGQEAECQDLDFDRAVLDIRVGGSTSISIGESGSRQKRAALCYEAIESLMNSELAIGDKADKPNPMTITCPLRSETVEENENLPINNEIFFQKTPSKTSK